MGQISQRCCSRAPDDLFLLGYHTHTHTQSNTHTRSHASYLEQSPIQPATHFYKTKSNKTKRPVLFINIPFFFEPKYDPHFLEKTLFFLVLSFRLSPGLENACWYKLCFGCDDLIPLK